MGTTFKGEHLRALPGGADPARDDLDGDLVTRAMKGDGAAWARLYQRHFDRLYRDLLYLVESPATAEELVQETFAAALVALPRFDRQSSVVTWLRGIGHNLVRRHWRTHVRRGRAYEKVERTATAVADDPRDDPEAHQLQDQRAEALSRALDTLPASLREVFVLRDVQGLGVDEVAGRLAISEGNVRVRANRAREKIRAELVRTGWLERDKGADA